MPKKQCLGKIKASLNTKRKFFSAMLAAAILSVAVLVPQVKAASSVSDPANPAGYSGLPVSGVKAYPAAGSQGTVILIPQYHRDPSTTDINDPANDSGMRDQQQTVDILNRLVDKGQVKLIMVEGDLQGRVPQDKIDHLKNELAARDQLAQDMDSLKQLASKSGAGQAQIQQEYNQLSQKISYADRDILLQGAPLVLKAQGKDITLIGSENQQTLDAAAGVVRDYVYLNDRITQVKQTGGGSPNSITTAFSGNGLQQIIQQLLSGKAGAANNPLLDLTQTGGKNPLTGGLPQISGAPALGKGNILQTLQQLMGAKTGGGLPSQAGGQNLQQLIAQMLGAKSSSTQGLAQLASSAQAQGNSQLVSVLSKIGEDCKNLDGITSQTFAAKPANAPSRADNPYASVNDLGTLQKMLDQNQQKINAVVVDQRNQEAAVSLAQAMKSSGENTSVLQFGAGHEQGLVSELNKQKLSVVVITTNEVATRAKQQN